MAQSSKSLTLARLEDMTLGAFASVPQSSTLGRLVDYLGTFGGNEFSARMLPTVEGD